MRIVLLSIALLCISKLSAQHTPHLDDDGRTIKIPVVFHVVNRKAIKKMTYTKAQEIIEQLNKNFAGKSDMSSADATYMALAGNPNISFYLADHNIQPNGDKGIVTYRALFVRKYRRSLNKGRWLNVFVGNFGTSSDLLSKTSRSTWLRINYKIVDDGSSLTHEVGHWLGLLHVWGKGNCSYKKDELLSDGIADTPPQKTCTDVNRKTCTPTSPNRSNFMDYSACRCIFTKDQSQQMRNNIINYKRDVFDGV